MATRNTHAGSSNPSPWYFLTLALGCAGLAFLAMALWSSQRSMAGLDPTDGIGNAGAFGLAVGFGLLFAERATRLESLPESLRRLIGAAIALMLWLSVAGASYAVFRATQGSGNLAVTFTAFTCICDLGALAWLLRFRNPGSGQA